MNVTGNCSLIVNAASTITIDTNTSIHVSLKLSYGVYLFSVPMFRLQVLILHQLIRLVSLVVSSQVEEGLYMVEVHQCEAI
jgi:hypothetical protein